MNIPKGFEERKDATVYINPISGQLVITGMPDEDDETHNCDHMGCSSVSHVIYRGIMEVSP